MAARLKTLMFQSARWHTILPFTKIPRLTICARSYRTSSVSSHWLDARDPNKEEKERQLVNKQGNIFDEAKKTARDKVMFHQAVNKYLMKHTKYRRGSVEFIYAAMGYMEEFGVHRDIDTYKKLLSILPKHVMVAKTVLQAEFMHYPKQQQCITDLMEKMESHGVIPDDEFGYMLNDVFGKKAHVFRRYQKMMYWLPKFRNANPYPVPYNLPKDDLELAKLALKRMAVDLENKLTVFQTSDLEAATDDTFIVSASSPAQTELIDNLDSEKAVFVEGGFKTWLRGKWLTYFILRSETTEAFKQSQLPVNEEEEENTWFKSNPFFSEEKPKSVVMRPSVHEQEDGTVLGMCITGTSTENSLRSWITFLQRTSPKLAHTPVIFSLITEEAGLEEYQDQQQKHYDTEAN